jgi:hypothetical protein
MADFQGTLEDFASFLDDLHELYRAVSSWQEDASWWSDVTQTNRRWGISARSMETARWLDQNTDHDSGPLSVLSDHLVAMRSGGWEPKPDEVFRVVMACRGLLNRIVNRLAAGESERTADSKTDSNQDPRPAYKRDHLWLRWHEEGMGPAAIRDRWNMLSDAEREKTCPKLPGRVGGADAESKKAGRATVITGLKKAKQEKKA